jgi:hypothetical protein
MYELIKEFYMRYLTVTLILIMIITGLFGGLINSFLASGDASAGDNAIGNNSKNSIYKSLAIGVGASFLVPLFLNMISSNLLELSKQDASKLLVFAGFCLIAAISSRAFITSISDRILNLAKTANQTANEANQRVRNVQPKVDALTAKETEPHPASLMSAAATTKDTEATVSENEEKVLKALGNPVYTFRFLPGIVTDTGLPSNDVVDILSDLTVKKELVAKTLDKEDRELFFLTSKGRQTLTHLS